MAEKVTAGGLSASSRNIIALLENLAVHANVIQRGAMRAAATHIRQLESDLVEERKRKRPKKKTPQPTADRRACMEWWNGMTVSERQATLRDVEASGIPKPQLADCWEYWKENQTDPTL